jgi:hypothetical protein
VALGDGGGHAIDRLAVADVAQLVFPVELLGEGAQQLLAARDEYRQPAAPGEPARDRLTDAGRSPGDDGYAANVLRV